MLDLSKMFLPIQQRFTKWCNGYKAFYFGFDINFAGAKPSYKLKNESIQRITSPIELTQSLTLKCETQSQYVVNFQQMYAFNYITLLISSIQGQLLFPHSVLFLGQATKQCNYSLCTNCVPIVSNSIAVQFFRRQFSFWCFLI